MTTPTWPPNINYLAERGSFKLTPGQAQLRSEFDYGPARMRRRFTREVSTFSFRVKMSETELALFEGFWADDLKSGTAWFNMPVYLGRGGYETRAVRFMEPYSLADAGFRHVMFSVKLEVKMVPIVSGAGAYFVGNFGEDALFDLSDTLALVVNVDYPAVMEDY